jgi:chemotaxis protein methyltransferase CheR
MGAAAQPATASRGSAPPPTDEQMQLRHKAQALANSNQLDEAENVVAEARKRYPVATEFIFLHMMILLAMSRYQEAALSASQLIYLDRTLAIAHFLQGTSLRAIGDTDGARRAFRNALQICAEHSAQEPVAFSEGESHGRLGQAAARHLATLDTNRKQQSRDG